MMAGKSCPRWYGKRYHEASFRSAVRISFRRNTACPATMTACVGATGTAGRRDPVVVVSSLLTGAVVVAPRSDDLGGATLVVRPSLDAEEEDDDDDDPDTGPGVFAREKATSHSKTRAGNTNRHARMHVKTTPPHDDDDVALRPRW